jgi:hypothetical protein
MVWNYGIATIAFEIKPFTIPAASTARRIGQAWLCKAAREYPA